MGIVTSPELEMKVSGCEPVDLRIIILQLDLERKVPFIHVYAPTEDSTVLDKDEFYSKLQNRMDKETVGGRLPIIAGDLYARTGQNKTIAHGSIGNHGAETTLNDNGSGLILRQ